MAGACFGCYQADQLAERPYWEEPRKCLRCQPLPPSSPRAIWKYNGRTHSRCYTKQQSSGPGPEAVAKTPETLSYALVAHKGNSGEVAQVNGVYMSSSLAAEKKADSSSFERFESRLLGSQKALASIKRKHVFRFMDLLEDLRRIILEMAMPDSAEYATLEMSSKPLVLCQICGLEETNLGLLSATAAAGDQRLRQETILVMLEKGVVTIDDWYGRVAKWLGRVDFGLLRQAEMTAHLTGYDAVRRLHINNCYADGSMEIAKFKDLRELILTDWSGRVVRDISNPEYSDLDLPGLGEGGPSNASFAACWLLKL